MILGRLRRHLPQALELAVGHLACFRREARLVEARDQLLELVVALDLAQLLLDDVELLAQHVFALVLVEPQLDLLLDLAAHLEHLQLGGEQLGEPLEAACDVVEGEQLRLGREREVQVSRDEVGELARVVDPREHLVQLLPEIGGDVDHPGELRHHRALQRLDAGVLHDLLGKDHALRGEPVDVHRHVHEPGAL